MKPLVSVKVITYNHVHFIKACLDSLLAQKTDFPFEIVIGEDYSTDGTREIVKKYARLFPKKIRVIFSDTNVGPFLNGLRISKACRGKYIAWCDGDDYWTDCYKLKKQVDFLEKNPEYGLIYSDIIFINEKNEEIQPNKYFIERRKKSPSGDVFWELLKNNFINTNTAIIRSNLYLPYLPSNQKEMKQKWYIHDYWNWLIISRHSKVMFFREKMAAYRTHTGNLTNSKDRFFRKNKIGFVKYDIVKQISRNSVNKKSKILIDKILISIILNKKSTFKLRFLAFVQLIRFFPSFSFLINTMKIKYQNK